MRVLMLMLCSQRMKYEQLGEDRNLASVRVLTPETAMGEMWQLVWTIKRHRDPNVRKSFLLDSRFFLSRR